MHVPKRVEFVEKEILLEMRMPLLFFVVAEKNGAFLGERDVGLAGQVFPYPGLLMGHIFVLEHVGSFVHGRFPGLLRVSLFQAKRRAEQLDVFVHYFIIRQKIIHFFRRRYNVGRVGEEALYAQPRTDSDPEPRPP